MAPLPPLRRALEGVPMIRFRINGQPVESFADPDTPLLWVLRDGFGLTGTKYGCGRAQCGACTVHVDGQAVAHDFREIRGDQLLRARQ